MALRRDRSPAGRAWTWVAFGLSLTFGCGARTSLESAAASNASADASPDHAEPFDAGLDSPADAADAEPIDSQVPPGCDAGAHEVWLLSQDDSLFVFDPLNATATRRATVDCPVGLNSMTVSRGNVGYVNAHDGRLFTVNLETGHCTATAFDPLRYGLNSFGMGFAADNVPAGETLYVAPRDPYLSTVNALGTIDVYGSFAYTEIAPFAPPLPPTEVTGTGDGRLFGVHVSDNTTDGQLFQIDKRTGAILDRVPLPITQSYSAFDFAFWGGSFYIFIAYTGDVNSRVIRYTPGQGGPQQIATIEPIVIGAGVSTCAPL